MQRGVFRNNQDPGFLLFLRGDELLQKDAERVPSMHPL